MTKYSKEKKRLKARILRAKSALLKNTHNNGVDYSSKIPELEDRLATLIASVGNPVPRKRSAA